MTKTIYMAPAKPKSFICPECECERLRNKLRFKYSWTTSWGTVVTRYDYYTCKECGNKFVSINGRSPDLAA